MLKFVSVELAIGLVATAVPVAAQEIKLGFTPPLTWVSAAQGAYQSKAITLALKQINEADGVNGKKINLRIADNQSTISVEQPTG